MDNSHRFTILMHKNLKTKVRNKRAFISQFVVIFICILLQDKNAKREPSFAEVDEVIIDKLDNLFNLNVVKENLIHHSLESTWAFGYTPVNSIFTKIVKGAGELLKVNNVIPFDNQELLEERMIDDPLIVGIEFPFNQENITTTPSVLEISLRFPSSFRTFHSENAHQNFWITHNGITLDQEWAEINLKIKDRYVNEGFLQIQNALFLAYFDMVAEKLNKPVKAPEIIVHSYEKHVGVSYSVSLADVSNINGITFFILFLVPCINLISEIMRERKSNIMVQFTLYGFPSWVHWVAHFCAAMILFICLDVMIIGLMKVKWIYGAAEIGPHHIVNFGALFLFFVLHNIAMIMFCFMIVNICRRLRIAMFVTLILWVVMYSVFSIILNSSTELRFYMVLCSFLFFNNVFTYGVRVLLRVNKHLFELLNQRTEIFYIFGMLIVDTILYFLVAYFFDRLIPQSYIENKPLPYISKHQKPIETSEVNVNMYENNFQYKEFMSRGSKEAVSCSHVFKYHNGRPILRNISLKIFENEVTVLLGHNGSGKTTLLCIIAGLKQPTRGTVQVYDKEPKQFSENIYFLPHGNTLFDRLTVKEHLIYVMTAKNVNPSLKDFELLKWMQLLSAHGQSREVVADMNYEQKRLLCLALALCGETRIVLLDEPTMNMTVEGRKTFWEIVRTHKRGRSIIVATNSLIEAEYVGDRFAIMQQGIVLANGTAFYLKVKFAGTHYLICIKKPECETEQLTQIVKTYIPSAVIENDTKFQVIYKISMEHDNVFSNLLLDLESKLDELKLQSINIMGNQLSDVYVSFGEQRDDVNFLYNRGQSIMENITLLRGCSLITNQMCALIFKKYLLQRPDRVPTIMMVVSIVIILVMGQMSKYMIAEHVQQTKIDIGFYDRYVSDEIFDDLLTINYASRYPIVEIGSNFYEKSQSRVITWNPVISRVLKNEEETNQIKSVVAIKLPETSFHTAKLWFNERQFHSAPLGLNLLHNALLRMGFKTSNYVVKITNKPLPIDIEGRFSLLKENKGHMKLVLVIGTAMPFIISSFIIYLVNNRASHVQSLECIAGIKIYIYWLVPLFWDLCIVLCFNFLFTTVFIFLTVEGYRFSEKLIILFIMSIYGFAGLCETYFLSCFFNITELAYLACSLIHFMTGLFAYALYWISLDQMEVFWWVAMLFPDFAVLDGLGVVYIVTSSMDLCQDEMVTSGLTMNELCKMYNFCCQQTLYQVKYPGIFHAIYFQLSAGLFFLLTVLALEYYAYEQRFDQRHTAFLHSSYGPQNPKVVLDEKRRINELSNEEIAGYNMVVDQLEDEIPDWGSVVNTISFAVQKNECLVILVEKNRSTKHLMLQLVGEEGFSFGDIYVRGINMKENLRAAQVFLGYCPKEYALLMQCTGHQLMEIICLIRGVRSNMTDAVIYELVALFEMHRFINTKVSMLSMDERRLINIAIAFIADVKIILIDQPTRGLSPFPRKLVWNVLRYAKFIGKSVIFTTTDPWECETLADQVILFSDGEMLYYGPLQKLRNHFLNGIIFEVKVRKRGNTEEEIQDNLLNDVSSIRRFVTFLSEESQLRSYTDGTLIFFIPFETLSWSKVFDLIEKNRERLNIENYLLSQSSFDDVISSLKKKRTLAAKSLSR